jgi:cAMP-dependent protein kinase regulator
MNTKEIRKLKDKATGLVLKEKFDKALKIYNKLREELPKDAALLIKIGDLNRRMGHVHEAIGTYSQAAQFYGLDGMLLRGIAVCKVILDIDSSHRTTQTLLADLYIRKYGSLPTKDKKGVLGAWVKESPPSPVVVGEIRQPEPAPQQGQEIVYQSQEADDDGELVPTESPESTLPHIPLFSDLDRDSFVALTNRIGIHHYGNGERVIVEGDRGESFFILVSGSVEIVKGRDMVMAKLDAGAFFGEIALITDRPRRASVVTLEPSTVLEISNNELDRLKEDHPQINDVLKGFAVKRLLDNMMLTSPIFRPFCPTERQDLMQHFIIKSFCKGQNIIEQGQRGDGMYLIISGFVDVFSSDGSDKEHHLAKLSEGDLFGEIALLTHSPATATVRAGHNCDLLCLPRTAFNEIISVYPQVLMTISEVADSRMQNQEDTPSTRGQAGLGIDNALL